MNDFDLALKYLSYASRTEKQMREYLEKKNVNDVDSVIVKLKEYNYINDLEYAKERFLINDLGNRYAKKRVFNDLKLKGIPEEIIREASKILTDEKEALYLDFHLKKIINSTKGMAPVKRGERISRYLLTKGFDYYNFKEVLATIRNEPASEAVFLKDFNHYYNLYKRKGLEKRALINKLKAAMYQKGHDLARVEEYLTTKEELW